MDLDDITKHGNKTNNEALLFHVIEVRLECYVFARDWNAAMELLIQSNFDRAVAMGLILVIRFTFFEGLVSMKAARLAKARLDKSKWKRKGLKSVKKMRAWAKQGNVNVVHMEHLLTAELASLQGKKEMAVENFKSAITVAARNGFLQDRALSHELTYEYFSAHEDGYWAEYHREQAKKYYSEWGAVYKN
ncbi:hypothetical protein ACHAXR_003457 [Thalassiosira sp. AJA248-18]